MDTPFTKKTSVQWLYESDYEIINATGWDKDHYDYSFYFEKISKSEFKRRLKNSIIRKKDKNGS
jgi:hypothetical protein